MKLIIKGLSKSFKNKKVLNGIDFEFKEGEIYGVIGRNGAGKTTLFKCINGDEELSGGEVLVEDNGNVRPIRFDDVGIVSSSPVLPDYLTGYEFIELFFQFHNDLVSDRFDIDDMFGLFNFNELDRHKLIKYYSFGMKNKLQLMCIMIKKPKIILLDEPLASFDIIVSHDIKERLIEMRNEHIILMSTHIVQIATDVSDELVILKGGVLKGVDRNFKDGMELEQYLVDELKEA